MSKAKEVGAGGAIPQAVDGAAAGPPRAKKVGDAKGKWCIGPYDNIADAWPKAEEYARADALRQVCNGGGPGHVSVGIERYFTEETLACVEGTVHVVCEDPPQAPAAAPETKETRPAGETTGKTAKPKATPQEMTEAEQRKMAAIKKAMMAEMRWACDEE